MLFLDSASLDDARAAAHLPFVGGVSLNPTLLARALGTNVITRDAFRRHLRALADIVSGTLFVQTIGQDVDTIMADAREIVEAIEPRRVVVKIPFSVDGLRATGRLERDGIQTCTTAVFTPVQAFLAATSRASWIAPYCNRITAAGGDGVASVRRMVETLRANGLGSSLLVASVKSLAELEALLETGAHHVTVPLALLEAATRHDMSVETGARFGRDLQWAPGQQQRETSS